MKNKGEKTPNNTKLCLAITVITTDIVLLAKNRAKQRAAICECNKGELGSKKL